MTTVYISASLSADTSFLYNKSTDDQFHLIIYKTKSKHSTRTAVTSDYWMSE